MRKLNIMYEGKDSILKIKDDSLIITLEEEMIKIPYSNIKGFNYDEEKEELTLVRHGGSKVIINVQKDKDLLNKLELSKKEIKSDKKKTESKENTKSEIVKESKSNLELNNSEKKDNNTDGTSTIGVIIGLICICIPIYFVIKAILPGAFEGDKISGCYYITGHLYSNSDYEPSLCFESSKVKFDIKGDTVEFDYKWYSDTLYIENDYGDTLFRCTLNKDNNKLLKCSSYSEAIGTGSYIWEKR